jgi:hypothetical protein
MVQNALYDHTFNWVAYGIAPPSAPVITTTGTNTVARDSLGLSLGGIRLAQHEVPLRINSGSNTGPGFCFLDGSSVPLTDAQLATLYPTVQAYVDEVVAVTLANAEKGYIASDFTRDPAWYSDIRELIGQYGSRIDARVADNLRVSLARAEQSGLAGDEFPAILHLDLLAEAASREIGDAAARDAVLRPTKALSALLWTQADLPTSTTEDGTVAGIVPATLSLTLGAPATFGAFTPGVADDYDASTSATVISTAGSAALSVADASSTATGHLVNGAFSLPSALQARGTSAAGAGGALADVRGSASPTTLLTYSGPVSNDAVTLSFRQRIGANDALRTGSYSKTLTFTLSTTQP